jgi:myo-inositol 2-dehydrogenase/D-chiro-inositol 1-dehydrogenase
MGEGQQRAPVRRVGVIGLGFIGRVHLAGLRTIGVEVHAYDELPELRTRAVEEYGAVEHTSLESILGAVDVVDICTPTDTHAELAIAAAAAGKPVVSEKPLARTNDEAERIVRTFRDADLPLHVAQVVRFFPEYAAAQRQVAAGRIGQPSVVRLTREGGVPKWSTWLTNSTRSGGLILDVMIHDIDYARWICGDVVRVWAKQFRPSGADQVPTHAYAILTHVSGAISHITASWARENAGFRTSFEIAGSEGLLSYATDEHVPVRFAPPELAVAGTGLPPMTLEEDPYTTELKEFLPAIEGGPDPRVTAEDGAAAVAISLAAIESSETGRAIDLPVPDQPYLGSAPALETAS